jgi:hypothetical protein
MDQQTKNFVAFMGLLVAVCVIGHVIGRAVERKQFSLRELLFVATVVCLMTAYMVAMGEW